MLRDPGHPCGWKGDKGRKISDQMEITNHDLIDQTSGFKLSLTTAGILELVYILAKGKGDMVFELVRAQVSCQREGWLWGGLEVWSRKGRPHHLQGVGGC